jgi:hypothetical protein
MIWDCVSNRRAPFIKQHRGQHDSYGYTALLGTRTLLCSDDESGADSSISSSGPKKANEKQTRTVYC